MEKNYSLLKKKFENLSKEEFLFCMKSLKRFLKDKGYYGRVKTYIGPLSYNKLFENSKTSSACNYRFNQCLGLHAFVGYTYDKDNASWSRLIEHIYKEWQSEALIIAENGKNG